MKPTVPLAPSRFATTTCWFSFSLSALATARAMTSTLPPAGNGTITSIGRAGQFCALANETPDANNNAAANERFQTMTFLPFKSDGR